jgi:hypothetical protein
MAHHADGDCNPKGLELMIKSLRKVQELQHEPKNSTHIFVVFGASGKLFWGFPR